MMINNQHQLKGIEPDNFVNKNHPKNKQLTITEVHQILKEKKQKPQNEIMNELFEK